MKLTTLVIVFAALFLFQGYGAAAPPSKSETLHSWNIKIDDATKRFRVLGDFNNEAVLDRETGLVWERSPLTTIHQWSPARLQCTNRTTGGRRGWRLPSVHELATLMDPNNLDGNPDLPAGHPFDPTAVQSADYWSATTNANRPADVANFIPAFPWIVNFDISNVDICDPTDSFFVWCVRGGMNADAY